VTEHLNKLTRPEPLTADYYNSLGLLYALREKHREATWAFQKALDLDDRWAVAFYNQALSLTALGRLDEAIDRYTHALQISPDFQDAYYNLGNVFKKKGFIKKAIQNYSVSVKLKPDFPEAYNNLGLCLKALKRFELAVECYEKSIEMKPDYAEAYNNLGLTLQEQGLWGQAIEKFESAITLKPDYSDAHYNLGFALNEIDKLDAAASHYRRSIQLKPDFADAYNNLGAILSRQGKIEEAIAHYRTALQYSPVKAEIYNNLGNALKKSGRIDEALEMLQRALAARPGYAEAFNNMGVVLQFRGDYPAALLSYEKAIMLKPEFAEARFNRATVDLLLGNFSRGWQGYEWRFRRRDWRRTYPHRYSQPRWDGSSFDGKTLYVHCEQGLGDILQFVRYLPWVKALGGRLILETIGPMVRLCRRIASVDQVVEPNPHGRPAVDFDYFIPLLSLPAIFNTTLDTIPNQIPYLSATPEDLERWRPRISPKGLRIGLVWAGTSTDPRRACPLAWFTPLTQLKNIHFYGLQKGIAAEQIEVEGLPKGMRLTNLGQEFEDFADTAAVVAQMDLVISIDTSVAHLAGAMGKPLWLLLPDIPDWRWLLDRNDTPWYPSAKLFRQKRPGEWQPVIQSIADDLVELARL